MSHPPPQISGIGAKILAAYVLWDTMSRTLPKIRKYSIGVRIDILFSELIELVSLAQFSQKEPRGSILSRAITKNDCLKFMIYVLLELKGIEEKQFFIIMPKMEEIGRMLYGWQNKN